MTGDTAKTYSNARKVSWANFLDKELDSYYLSVLYSKALFFPGLNRNRGIQTLQSINNEISEKKLVGHETLLKIALLAMVR